MRFSLGDNFLAPALFGALLSLIITTPILYRVISTMPLPVAVLDIAALTNEATDSIQAGSGTLEEKTKRMTVYAKSLETEITAITKECRCILVIKAAVMGDGAMDYTPVVRSRLKK
jgi:hypothetical protein